MHWVLSTPLLLFTVGRENDDVLPRLCYGELGCLETGPDFVHSLYRPFNMEPNSREQINVKFHIRSRQDPKGVVVKGTDLTRVLTSSFRPDRDTKITIHGFLNGRDMPWLNVRYYSLDISGISDKLYLDLKVLPVIIRVFYYFVLHL